MKNRALPSPIILMLIPVTLVLVMMFVKSTTAASSEVYVSINNLWPQFFGKMLTIN